MKSLIVGLTTSLLVVGSVASAQRAGVATTARPGAAVVNLKPFGTATTGVTGNAKTFQLEAAVSKAAANSGVRVAGAVAASLTSAEAIHGSVVTVALKQIQNNLKSNYPNIADAETKRLKAELDRQLVVGIAALDGVPKADASVKCDTSCVVQFGKATDKNVRALDSYFSQTSSTSQLSLTAQQKVDLMNSLVAFMTGEVLKMTDKDSIANALQIAKDFASEATRSNSRADAWSIALRKHVERMDAKNGNADRSTQAERTAALAGRLTTECL